MSTNVVHLIRETRSLLTKEFLNDRGKPTADVVDAGGSVIQRGEMHRAREVYMDSMTGDHFMRISPGEKDDVAKNLPAALAEADEVFQGVGEVHGWFVPAPDYTLFGRFGEHRTEETEEDVEAQAAPMRAAVKAAAVKKAAAKKKPGRR